MQLSENTVGLHSPNAVSMSGQRRRLWVNFETALVECHVFVQSRPLNNRPGDRLVIEPVFGG